MSNPLPNLVAAVLIGWVNEPWYAVLAACVGWAFIYSAYLWATGAHGPLIAEIQTSPKVWFDSPQLSLLLVTWTVVFVVSLAASSLTYFVRHLL